MQFNSLKILADENISPKVVSFLRQKGFDVVDVKEKGWQGAEDKFLMKMAYAEERFILTHDADFGTLAINEGIPCFGIIYLKVKDLRASNVIHLLARLFMVKEEIVKGSLVVVKDHRIRIRSIGGTKLGGKEIHRFSRN